jgi:pimeloyl-ACP methyl ester carboxylesterase
MQLDDEQTVRVPVEGALLDGDLVVPSGATGVVLFAHGSGSSRFSPRNRYVASVLQRTLATLMLDLLTPDEEETDRHTMAFRFDVDLLGERLVHATRWLRTQPRTRALAIGYFGSSTGAAAALLAAAALPDQVAAVVSRGGRPDLAARSLPRVYTPTLLLVGSRDAAVIPLNEAALAALPGRKELVVIPEATHLFEEPGALEQVAYLARDWFELCLGQAAETRPSR